MNSRQLREERARVLREAETLAGKSKLTRDERDQFNQLMARADALMSQIRMIEGNTAPPNSADFGYPENADQREQRQELRHYLRHGEVTGSLRERRDMGTGGGNALQGTGGGFFVPVGFVHEVEQALKYYGPMLDAATILPTDTGQPLPYPTSNDTAVVGELVGEAAQVTANDVTLGSIVFNAFKYSTKMVKVSIELLQDSAFDIEKFLKDQFAIRLGRILNTHFTVGLGTTQPNGILTAATAGPTAVGSSGNTGGSETGGTSIGSDDIFGLEHSVDRLYRDGAAYMMHDLTLQKLKQIKDKFGRPLWLPALAGNTPATLNGYPYYINNDLPQVAINNKTVLFGQIKKYMIRQVKQMSVLRLVERFADFGQVAFIGFARYDGNLLDAGTHPVKYLVQAAS